MKQVILIGAGKHAVLLAEKIFEDPHLELLGFIDNETVKLPEFILKKGYKVLGDDNSLVKYRGDFYFHLALGGELIEARKRLIDKIDHVNLKMISVIHQTAYISPTAILGRGVTVLINSIVHTNAKIGDFSCINNGAIVEHDCTLGNNIFIQPYGVLAGSVKVGNNTVVGMGASVKEGIAIGANCLIGACSFVNKDLPDNSVAYGVPARIVHKRDI